MSAAISDWRPLAVLRSVLLGVLKDFLFLLLYSYVNKQHSNDSIPGCIVAG